MSDSKAESATRTLPDAARPRAPSDTSSVLAGALFLVGAALHWQAGAPVLVVAAFLSMPPILLLALFARRQQRRLRAARKSMRRGLAKAAAQAARHLEALSDSERRFHGAFTQASIGMALVSTDGSILQANAAMAGIFGIGRSEELTRRPLADLVAEPDGATLMRELQRVVAGGAENFVVEGRGRHAGGAELWVSLHGALLPDAEAPSLIVQLQDVSARRHAQAQLKHIAFHDGLTGLPNRNRFGELLASALEDAQADASQHFALLYLDFDRFKLVNDSMGHSAGDEFLIHVSRRMQELVRPGDALARLGGDEFALLVRRVREDSDATQLAQRLLDALKRPIVVGGVSVGTSASIGITFSRLGYTAPQDLLRDADIAMYRAKAAGKARYALFDARLHTEVTQRVQLEADLRQAILAGEIDLAYQPLFHIGSGRLRGFEALARWQHPTRGSVPPSVFIPVAEDSGLIIALSDQVLDRACAHVRRWQQRDNRLHDLKLQVNLSGADLADAELPRRVERALRASGLEPRLLTLELTENILMQRVAGAIPTLEALRRLGVVLAIDDFGTGYSSLSYLSTLPIDSLKIDQSFVRGMRVAGSKEAEIVRAIVSLAGTLGKTVVAEGIESQSQLMQLHALGCEHGQGFHLSRPLAAPEVEALLDFLTVEPRDERLRLHDSTMMPLMAH